MRKRVPERTRAYAKELRTGPTGAQWRLWGCLRAGRLAGLKFKRQVPMDGYIIDFVCLEARLIIKVDGGQHAESVGDQVRDTHFARSGFRTLRFWNRDVLDNVHEVAHQIQLVVQGRVAMRSGASSPLAGEDSEA